MTPLSSAHWRLRHPYVMRSKSEDESDTGAPSSVKGAGAGPVSDVPKDLHTGWKISLGVKAAVSAREVLNLTHLNKAPITAADRQR